MERITLDISIPKLTLDYLTWHAPFRVGRRQGRAVLDRNGAEVVIFPKAHEHLALFYCEQLNAVYFKWLTTP